MISAGAAKAVEYKNKHAKNTAAKRLSRTIQYLFVRQASVFIISSSHFFVFRRTLSPKKLFLLVSLEIIVSKPDLNIVDAVVI